MNVHIYALKTQKHNETHIQEKEMVYKRNKWPFILVDA